jgi:hypothetical protein
MRLSPAIGLAAALLSPACVPQKAVVLPPGPPPGGPWPLLKQPFDLAWHTDTQVDANGLPLNPLWAYQVYHPGQKPSFQGTCAPAFSIDGSLKPGSELANVCTSQSPDPDLSMSGLDLFGFCHAEPVRGHLNWGLATFQGTVQWEEWEGDDFLFDDDYNLGLYRDDNAALTNLGDGLGLEFRASETIDNFHSPWWLELKNAVEGKDANSAKAHSLVDNSLAVVTGLFGIDGVHGGYTEAHPVFALAVCTNVAGPPDTGAETWAFFIRNIGNEGNCSNLDHRWDGLEHSYYVQLPWPANASGVAIVPDGSQAWSFDDQKVSAPVFEESQGWTYLRFDSPDPTAPFIVDGEIRLRYTFAAGASPAPPASKFRRRTAHREENGGEKEVRKKLGKKGFAQARQLMGPPAPPPARANAQRTPVRLPIDARIVAHQARPGPAGSGNLTRDITAPDAAKDTQNTASQEAAKALSKK